MNISGIIRHDKEFKAFVDTLRSDINAKTPLPIVINGLSGGAVDAFVTEAVKEVISLSRHVIVLTADDAQRGAL